MLNLKQAELVLLPPQNRYAIALGYEPGGIPYVIHIAEKEEFDTFILNAQGLGIPILEASELPQKQLKEFKVGEEIPDFSYRLIAHCIKLAQYTLRKDAKLLRFVQPTETSVTYRRKIKRRVSQLHNKLDLHTLQLNISSNLEVKGIQEIIEYYREKLISELGVPIPPIAVSPKKQLQESTFSLRVFGIEAYSGDVPEDPESLETVLGQGLTQVILRYAWKLLGLAETEALIANLKKSNPSLVKAVVPKLLEITQVRTLLRKLLKERLSIRNLSGIFESVLDNAHLAHDVLELTEAIRSDMRDYISQRFSDRLGTIYALLATPSIEQALRKVLQHGNETLPLNKGISILSAISRGLETAVEKSVPAVLLCSPDVRAQLFKLIEPSFPFIPVMSYSEIAPLTKVVTLETLSLDQKQT